MELPTAKTPVSKCLALGRYTAQMLSKFFDNDRVMQDLFFDDVSSRAGAGADEDPEDDASPAGAGGGVATGGGAPTESGGAAGGSPA